MADQKHSGLRTIDTIALVLVLIGAINWGLVGLFAFDLVAAIFGETTVLSRTILSLAALAVAHEFVRCRAALAHQTIRVRTRGGYG